MDAPTVTKLTETARSLFLRLPVDVTDVVVDHCYDDTPTLLSLSLVSRQWLWCSQYHLFYSIRLRAVDANYTASLERFFTFASRYPKVASRIRELTLGRKPHFATHPTVSLSRLITLLQILPSLHKLILHSCELDASDYSTVSQSSLPMRKLVLSCLRADAETFRRWLSSIRVQHTLQLLSIAVARSPDPLGTPYRGEETEAHMASVHSLTLEPAAFISRSTLAYYDAVLAGAKTLTYLDIGPMFDRDSQFDRLSEFLNLHGSSLLHLRLELCCTTIPPQDTGLTWRNIDLARKCPSLQSLHLTLLVSGVPHTHSSDAAQWEFSVFLLSMTSTSIQHITFGLFCNAGLLGLLTAPDWRRLDRTLAPLGALERVLFQRETREADGVPMAKHVHPIPRSWEEFIREQLPLAQAANLLSFRP